MAEFDGPTIHQLWQWLAECANAWITDLALNKLGVQTQTVMTKDKAIEYVASNGAKRIYHWLKTYRRFVQSLQQSHDRVKVIGTLALRGYLINADHSASAHAGSLPKVSFQCDQILTSVGLQAETIFDHQREAGRTTGSALLVAPTGSGKTEAALLWVAHQA
ncbi:MAG TPA: hypothetical protein PKE45_14110 [Caldilineaceae bacterium]|nr:hypothetical protein [Caldilineaceae bacterium]